MAWAPAAIAAVSAGMGLYSSSQKEKRDKKTQKELEKFYKSGKAYKKMDPYSKGQRKLLDWLTKSIRKKGKKGIDITRSPLYRAGSEYLQDMLSGDSEAYQKFEAPAMRQFYEDILPEIAEKYAGAGAGSSSAFGLAATHAGGALSEQLAAMRENLRMQAVPQALGYAQQPISNQAALLGQSMNAMPYQYTNMPAPAGPSAGFGEQLSGGLAQIGGQVSGTMLGNQLGSWLSGMGGSSGGGFEPGSTQRFIEQSQGNFGVI